jgi:5-methylcytosine-specific restriction endonuclease McrA
LVDATVRAAHHERCATVELLALLAELDVRKLYLGEGCASLFTYCTQVLHLSEHAAYHRIEVARAAQRFPAILTLVADGALTLTTVAMLRPHLTPENHEGLLAMARHKSKREVEQQVACLAPKPEAQTLIRRIAEVKPDVGDRQPSLQSVAIAATGWPVDTRDVQAQAAPATKSRPSPPPTVASLTGDRYLLRVTLSAEAHANLRRAQDLMRHTVPTGDAAEVLERALELLVDRLERVKTAAARTPRIPVSKPRTKPASSATAVRRVPARVRRAVWARDQGRCAFVGPRGRCTETGHLEYHHVLPFARGGAASISNIALRCRAHNRFESDAIFGRWRSPSVALGPDRVG